MTDVWDEIIGNFEGFQKQFDRMMKDIGEGRFKTCGYTVYTGPDGVPHMHKFDSETGPGAEPDIPAGNVREPLTDVCMEGDLVRIVIELPGVNKEDIRLEGTETSMTVTVDTETRKFRKTVSLPSVVDQDTAKAEYNNGILEVTVNSRKKEQESKRISVV